MGLLALAPQAGALDNPDPTTPAGTPAKSSQPLSLPAGFEKKDVKAESGVKSGLVKLTDRAVTTGDFNRFLAELSKQDRERAREFKGADQTKLDGIINQIRKDWKSKYGQDFAVNDKNLVFNEQFAMVQGEVTNPAVAINNWPVAPIPGEAVVAGSRTPGANDKQAEKEAKLTKGRNVAVIRFPASHGLPEMDVSMIHHAIGFWRVDVPNDRTGEQIYNDLTTHLTYIKDHPDQWPSDVSDAYRMVAHHAVAALYGAPVSSPKG